MTRPDIANAASNSAAAKSSGDGLGGGRGLALVVDDDLTSRRLLQRMLDREGFRTQEATNGFEALAAFEAERPDIVFMDALMPEMDGFETTLRLKQQAGVDFIPVIFLTALNDEPSLLRCFETGGDDVLTKPFNMTVLKARILAMERVRDLHRLILAKNKPLTALIEREREEQVLAERVFARAIKSRNLRTDRIGIIQRPAATFSGDVILTQHLPDGGLRVLLGDFTGHGLAATIGALPVVDAFHTMTRKGVSDEEVLKEINRKLYEILPVERFMAACIISISGDGQELRWWNGGMPGLWLRRADGLHQLKSHALPLGVLEEMGDDEPLRVTGVEQGDIVLMYSDGLMSARDAAGVSFESAALSRLLSRWKYGQSIFPSLIQELNAHCGETVQVDDVALLEIPLQWELFEPPEPVVARLPEGAWTWSLELTDEHLGRLRSLDIMLRPLGLLDGLEAHLSAIETVLCELYSNALEHGILQLPSSMKASPDGFDCYYYQRAASLAAGCRGRISLLLEFNPSASGGVITISVVDSGSGFSELAASDEDQPSAQPWGRGIRLVRGLCESLTYSEGGRRAVAVYRW